MASRQPPDQPADRPGRRPTILHVDLDAFFAAVEVLDEPSLAGRPVIVGGAGRRGVVASCTYEARTFGVRSAMPAAEARRRCPQAVFVAGRYHRYAEMSRRLHDVFHRYTPLVEGIALDEAFLDVAGSERLLGPAPEIARRLREEVATELRLSCSVGVAATKFLAKLASEAAKPRASPAGVVPGQGVVVVEPDAELAFLHPHPVEALWGVGPATGARLRRLGVTTVGELASVPLSTLEASVGRAHGRHLHALAWARDPRTVQPSRAPKSVSHEQTYAFDRFDRTELHRELVRLADAVAGRLRAGGLAGRTVTVKVRFGDFTTITRSLTLAAPEDTAPGLAAAADGLLARVDVSPGVRLLGLAVSGVASRAGEPGVEPSGQLAEQLSLDVAGEAAPEAGGEARASTSAAVDAIRRRFGDAAVGPASLLEAGRLRLLRQGDAQWGPGDDRAPDRH